MMILRQKGPLKKFFQRLPLLLLFFSSMAESNDFNFRHFTTHLPLISIQTGGEMIMRRSEIPGHFLMINRADQKNSTYELLSKIDENDQPINVRRRGNSSDKFAQKQYQIEFMQPSSTEDKEVPLLGMSKSSKWVINAPYVDLSLMRNALAYQTARKFPDGVGGQWYAPRTQFAELVVNKSYKGLFTVVERIDRGKDKVPVKKFDEENPVGTDFMVKADPIESGDLYFCTPGGINLIYVYPKKKKILEIKNKNPQLYKQYENYTKRVFARFEESLQPENLSHPTKGYKNFIDVPSFVNYMIIQELFKNVDGYRRSVYLYVKDGKIHAGPVWDFNVAMGNLWFYNQHKPHGWQHGRKYMKKLDGNHEIPWFRRLLKDKQFAQQFITQYQQLRKPGQALDLEVINQDIDQFVAQIGDAQKRHFNKWDILGKPIKPLYFSPPPWKKTYRGEIINFKSWLRQRIKWLDYYIPLLINKTYLQQKEKEENEEKEPEDLPLS